MFFYAIICFIFIYLSVRIFQGVINMKMSEKEIMELEKSCRMARMYSNYIKETPCFFERQRYEMLMLKEIEHAAFLIRVINKKLEENFSRQDREFTLEELASFNGADGKPAYIAVDGVVYDVSNNAAWGGGTHFGLTAGTDVTSEFKTCHKEQILSKLPRVGVLKNI